MDFAAEIDQYNISGRQIRFIRDLGDMDPLCTESVKDRMMFRVWHVRKACRTYSLHSPRRGSCCTICYEVLPVRKISK